ncbi:MAG: hypothetical protein NZ529_08435 [Cytophagaceae bacterium]|nr:hypothetical protein [Cytophagaceae bacterium]MDW8456809.1 hypothetical protein [Cytophagaceae bacterium]
MKTQHIILAALTISLITFVSCKKDKDPTPTEKSKPSDQAGSNEADEAIEDVNDVINNKIGGGAGYRVASYNLPCGVVKIDSNTTNAQGKKVYVIKYGSQTPCGYEYKSGDVKFELINGNKFSDTGAVYKITFINYKVEVRANGQTVALNGTIYVTNVSGGYVWMPIVNSSVTIVHKLRGSFNVTFNDEVTRPRNYYQRRTWSSTGGWAGLTFEANGDTTINGKIIAETGNTYEHNFPYQTEIITPLRWSNCGNTWAGPYVLKTGEAKAHAEVPNISPVYFQVEAGYKMNSPTQTEPPIKVNDCTSNAYKITVVIGQQTTTQYQMY